MRILFILDKLPFPANTGDRLRIYNLVRRVAERHDVWLAVLADAPEDTSGLAHLAQFCRGIEVAYRSHQSPWAHVPGVVAYALRGRPLELKFNYSTELMGKIGRLSARVNFDIVQIEHSYMALYAEAFADRPNTKRILDFHNVELSQSDRIARVEPRLEAKARAWLHGRMMRRWEPSYAEHFDRCLTCSAVDRDLLLSANPRLRVSVAPNGVDAGAYQPLAQNSAGCSLIFVGTMSYAPSVDAMQYFCGEVLPRIRRQQDVDVWIVGKDPAPEVKKLAGNGVIVTGGVPDVVPYYRRCSVAVAPLRAGSGTRLKILEAMALGRPVVSTSIGCEGLDVVDGRDLLIADDATDFAAKTVRLLRDETLARDLASNGRRLVADRYDWGVVAGQLLDVYESLWRGG